LIFFISPLLPHFDLTPRLSPKGEGDIWLGRYFCPDFACFAGILADFGTKMTRFWQKLAK
jgi:hypothetical protein